ncbi:hypothetical protein GCM10017784_11040 [Deinococcus indicus]|nr:hypothetical protein GCM10017784_11040 [Deinococcus indicus]
MKHLFPPLTVLIFLMLYLRNPTPDAPAAAQGDLLAPMTQMVTHIAEQLTISAVLAALFLLTLGLLGRFLRAL